MQLIEKNYLFSEAAHESFAGIGVRGVKLQVLRYAGELNYPAIISFVLIAATRIGEEITCSEYRLILVLLGVLTDPCVDRAHTRTEY